MTAKANAVSSGLRPMRYKLRRDRFEYPAGTVVYRFHGADYGLAGEDRRATGVEHMSVTLSPSGDYPFFTVPVTDVEPLP